MLNWQWVFLTYTWVVVITKSVEFLRALQYSRYQYLGLKSALRVS